MYAIRSYYDEFCNDGVKLMTLKYSKLMTLIYNNRDENNEKFTSGIVVSTVLGVVSILMFIVSFYAIIIPMFERSVMDRKKEMIHELTNTAWSVLSEYDVV